MDYEALLNKAYEKLPKIEEGKDRFKIPIAETFIQGNQTIIKNFFQITEILRREPSHVLKFLAKELAAPAGLSGERAIFQSKISQKLIQQKIEAYINEYVLCKECKKPDTKLVKEDRLMFLKCEVCGAKAAVKAIK
ncbi:MAG: translation initiation factor IF-2 subunit beta [Candidatus Aenigmatarchaeota archaeon]